MAKRISDTSHIVSQLNGIVGFNLVWAVATSIPTLIRNCHLETGCNQRIDLMAPQIPTLRESMQKNDKGSTTLDYRLEFDTILFRSFANYVAALSCSFASRHIRVFDGPRIRSMWLQYAWSDGTIARFYTSPRSCVSQ